MTSYTARWCCFTIVCGWYSTCNAIYVRDRYSKRTQLYSRSRPARLCLSVHAETQSRAGRAFKDPHSYTASSFSSSSPPILDYSLPPKYLTTACLEAPSPLRIHPLLSSLPISSLILKAAQTRPFSLSLIFLLLLRSTAEETDLISDRNVPKVSG